MFNEAIYLLIVHGPAKHALNQIAKLLSGELVSFQIRSQISIAINDDGMKSVCEESFVAPEIHSEALCDLANLR